MLRELGATVVDADLWARRVVEPGQPALAEIVKTFGADVLQPDGMLDRARLGSIVFHDASARNRLNAITHPRIREGMWRETEEALAAHPDLPVVWDVPLLFEGGMWRVCDATIVVYVDEQTQRQRLMRRNHLSAEEADARIRAQMPMEEKRRRADYVIDNRGTIEETRKQVEQLWQTLRARASRGGAS